MSANKIEDGHAGFYCTFFFLLLTLSGVIHPTKVHAGVPVIFDTDLGSDCDDAGAMAVLHKLADDGHVDLLATIHSSRPDQGDNPFGAGAMDAINTYYNRPDLRLGVSKQTDVGDPKVDYIKEIANDTERYGHDIVRNSQVENMVKTYVDLLKTHSDVVIITVGHPIALYHLLDRGYAELIDHSVDRWVAMGLGATWSRWAHDWNFTANGMHRYINDIIQNWPTQLYVSTSGKHVKTGKTLFAHYDNDNPVHRAYDLFLDGGGERSSWDQIATLFAAFGNNEWFSVDPSGRVEYRSRKNGLVRWTEKKNHPKQLRVDLSIPREKMEGIIEKYMTREPESRSSRNSK